MSNLSVNIPDQLNSLTYKVLLKRWNGTEWQDVSNNLFYYNGSQWIKRKLKFYNGTQWIEIGYELTNYMNPALSINIPDQLNSEISTLSVNIEEV